MGLFDKLKVAAGGTPKIKSTEPKEDLSGASLMELVEKIDAYNMEFCNNLNTSNYIKLETAMVELANRIPTIPLAQRTMFNSYSMIYKSYLDNYKKCIALGPKGKELAQKASDGLSSMCSTLVTVLNQ